MLENAWIRRSSLRISHNLYGSQLPQDPLQDGLLNFEKPHLSFLEMLNMHRKDQSLRFTSALSMNSSRITSLPDHACWPGTPRQSAGVNFFYTGIMLLLNRLLAVFFVSCTMQIMTSESISSLGELCRHASITSL